jgi:hypothetical protein
MGLRRFRLSRAPLGGIQSQRGSLFSGGKGLNPLLLRKASSPSPQVYSTFVSSHNAPEFNPISKRCPDAILAQDAVNFD